MTNHTFERETRDRFCMTYWRQGRSYDEIAALLGISRATVGRIIRRGRHGLPIHNSEIRDLRRRIEAREHTKATLYREGYQHGYSASYENHGPDGICGRHPDQPKAPEPHEVPTIPAWRERMRQWYGTRHHYRTQALQRRGRSIR